MVNKLKELYVEQISEDTVDKLWYMSTGAALDMQALKYGDKFCMIDAKSKREYSYNKLSEITDIVAANLYSLGIRKGDSVAVYALNSDRWIILMYALGKIGACLVAINTGFKTLELQNALQSGNVRMLIFDDGPSKNSFIENVKGLNRKYLENLEILMYMGQAEINEDQVELLSYDLLEKTPENQMLEKIKKRKYQVEYHETACVIYTSGSTDVPKGVELTHLGVLNVGKTSGYKRGLQEQDIECIPVPLFHCFGIILGVMACICRGAGIVLIDRFGEKKVLESVQQYSCTSILGVATMFSRMIYYKDFADYDVKSLRTGIVGGSACSTDLAYEIRDKMHMKDVVFGCGLTEDCGLAVMADCSVPFDYRIKIVGKDMPHVENKLIDIDTGEEVGINKVGELYTRGYNVMKGYCGRPDLSRKVLDDEGWLRTGDLYIRYEDGNL